MKTLKLANVKGDSRWGPAYRACRTPAERRHVVAAARAEYAQLLKGRGAIRVTILNFAR